MSLPNQSGHDVRGALDPCVQDVIGLLSLPVKPIIRFEESGVASSITFQGVWSYIPVEDTIGASSTLRDAVNTLSDVDDQLNYMSDNVRKVYNTKLRIVVDQYVSKIRSHLTTVVERVGTDCKLRMSLMLLFSSIDVRVSPGVLRVLNDYPDVMCYRRGDNVIKKLCDRMTSLDGKITLPSSGGGNLLAPLKNYRDVKWWYFNRPFNWREFHVNLLRDGDSSAYHMTMTVDTPHSFVFNSITSLCFYLLSSLYANQRLLREDLPKTVDRPCEMPILARRAGHSPPIRKLRALGMVVIPDSWLDNRPKTLKDIFSWANELYEYLSVNEEYDMLDKLFADETLICVDLRQKEGYFGSRSTLPPYDNIIWLNSKFQRELLKEILKPTNRVVIYEGVNTGPPMKEVIPSSLLASSFIAYDNSISEVETFMFSSTDIAPNLQERPVITEQYLRALGSAFSAERGKLITALQVNHNWKTQTAAALDRIRARLRELQGDVRDRKNMFFGTLLFVGDLGFSNGTLLPPRDLKPRQLNASSLKQLSVIIPTMLQVYGWDVINGTLVTDEDGNVIGSAPKQWIFLGAEDEPLAGVLTQLTKIVGVESVSKSIGYSSPVVRGDIDENLTHVRPYVLISDIQTEWYNDNLPTSPLEQLADMEEKLIERIVHWALQAGVAIWKINFPNANVLNRILDAVRERYPNAIVTYSVPSFSKPGSVEVYLKIIPRHRDGFVLDPRLFRGGTYFNPSNPDLTKPYDTYVALNSLTAVQNFDPFTFYRGDGLSAFINGTSKYSMGELPKMIACSCSLRELEGAIATYKAISKRVWVSNIISGSKPRFALVGFITPDSVNQGKRAGVTRKQSEKNVVPTPSAFGSQMIEINPTPPVPSVTIFNYASQSLMRSDAVEAINGFASSTPGAVNIANYDAVSIGGRNLSDLHALNNFKTVTIIDPDGPTAEVANALKLTVVKDIFDFTNPQFNPKHFYMANAVIIVNPDGTSPTRQTIIDRITHCRDAVAALPAGSDVVVSLSCYAATSGRVWQESAIPKGCKYQLVVDGDGNARPSVSFGSDYDVVPTLSIQEVTDAAGPNASIRNVNMAPILYSCVSAGFGFGPTFRSDVSFCSGFWVIITFKTEG